MPLTRTEFDLVSVLCSDPGRVFTRSELVERVWGHGWRADAHLVDVHISNLRRKLAAIQGCPVIRTIRGIGFAVDYE